MQATGFACDQCKTFETTASAQRPPDGWFSVNVHATVPVAPNASEKLREAAENGGGVKHFCGTRCFCIWGLDRYEAENDGKRLVRGTQKGVKKGPRQKKQDAS